jgi:hypothetical protein
MWDLTLQQQESYCRDQVNQAATGPMAKIKHIAIATQDQEKTRSSTKVFGLGNRQDQQSGATGFTSPTATLTLRC